MCMYCTDLCRWRYTARHAHSYTLRAAPRIFCSFNKKFRCSFPGSAALITVEVLLYPELELEDVGEILEWVCYAIIPPFSFARSLQDLYLNHVTLEACYGLVEDTDMTLDMLCEGYAYVNITSTCCKGRWLPTIFIMKAVPRPLKYRQRCFKYTVRAKLV